MRAGRLRALGAATLAPLLAIVLVPESSWAQTWFESYHQAEEALEEEDWTGAVRHLNAALEQKPESSAKARTYGMRFVAYFPFFKLGVAYQHLGQTEAALQAFETEERQGEIRKSERDFAELQRYRELILQAKAEAEDARRLRAEQVVRENLEAVRRLEQEERYDDALDAIAKVLAVSPDLDEAHATQQRLLDAVAEEERRRELDVRLRRLIEQGKAELASGDHRAAAASFTQALALSRDEDTIALLAQAQDGIRADIERRQASAAARDVVAESLERAAQLEAAGELDQALSELQSVLAVNPANRDARSLQARILGSQSAAVDEGRIRALLSDAESHLRARDFERALRSANHILALEPGHAAALRYIAQAYAGLSDALLATDNAPPSILFDDLREDGPRGKSELIRSPDFVLRGTVYDDSPVTLSVRSGGEELGDVRVQSREFLGVWIHDFTIRHDVDRGLSTLEIVAVDQAGETTVESYVVDYAAPFWRATWFPAWVAAGLAGVAFAFAGSRVCRRRRLRRKRFNPYIAGAPILEQKRFFGREQLLDYVLRRIHNNSIMLYGERRIGKTSFQHQLKQCLTSLDDPDVTFHPVFVDLQGTPQDRFFATMAIEIFHELESFLGGLEPHAALEDGNYGYREFVKDVHAVLKALNGRSKKRAKLVLLIDEVDELNDYDPRINQKLRSLFMRTFADSLVSVVSGVAIKKHWEREGSPWYNFFQEIEVQPLDAREAAALIEAPVRGVFTFSEGVVDEILRRTGGKPYLIQRICGALVDLGHDEQRFSFTISDLESVCQPEGL